MIVGYSNKESNGSMRFFSIPLDVKEDIHIASKPKKLKGILDGNKPTEQDVAEYIMSDAGDLLWERSNKCLWV